MTEELLTKPFPLEAHQFKVGVVSRQGDRALGFVYVDGRMYEERLDEVDPNWESEYRCMQVNGYVMFLCRLTVNEHTRTNVGQCELSDRNPFTSALAQAFKRTCASFGLGRYLYFTPKTWASYDSQKKAFTANGLKKLREELRLALDEPVSGAPRDTEAEEEEQRWSAGLVVECRKMLKKQDFTATYEELVEAGHKENVHHYLYYIRDLAEKDLGAENNKQFANLINTFFDVDKLTEAVVGHWLLLEGAALFLRHAKDKEKAKTSARRIVQKAVKDQQRFEDAAASIPWSHETGQPVEPDDE